MSCKKCGRDRRLIARDLCERCYRLFIEKKKAAICEGCEEFKPIKAKGLCNKCYARFQRHGDTSWERKKKGDTLCVYCKEKPMHAKGFCKACYGRFLATGSPEYRRRINICRAEECNEPSTYNGYCDKHNNQAWNKQKATNSHLVRTFNITTEDYKEMLRQQNNVCAICGEPETRKYNGIVIKLAVDHCHATGKVRGLLCSTCNIALGRFQDSTDLLTKAVNYLKQHE